MTEFREAMNARDSTMTEFHEMMNRFSFSAEPNTFIDERAGFMIERISWMHEA